MWPSGAGGCRAEIWRGRQEAGEEYGLQTLGVSAAAAPARLKPSLQAAIKLRLGPPLISWLLPATDEPICGWQALEVCYNVRPGPLCLLSRAAQMALLQTSCNSRA